MGFVADVTRLHIVPALSQLYAALYVARDGWIPGRWFFVVDVERFIVSVTKSAGIATYLCGHMPKVIEINFIHYCVNSRYYAN